MLRKRGTAVPAGSRNLRFKSFDLSTLPAPIAPSAPAAPPPPPPPAAPATPAASATPAAPAIPPPPAIPPSPPPAAAPPPRAVLDTANCPPAHVAKVRTRCLEHAGNQSAWKKCAELLRQQNVIVVWGPTGCGKSVGVEAMCARVLRTNPYYLSPTAFHGADEMAQKVAEVMGAKTLLGGRTVVADDAEAFDETWLRQLARICDTRARAACKVIVVCRDRFALALRAFRKFPDVQLRRPSERQLVEFGARTYERFSRDTLTRHARLSNGDLRQFHKRLHNAGRVRMEATRDTPSIFAATEQLLRGTCDVDAWLESGGPNALQRILHVNYPKWSSANVAELCASADAFAEADARGGRLFCLGAHFRGATSVVPRLALPSEHGEAATLAPGLDGFSALAAPKKP